MNKLKVIELFSGIGSYSKALERLKIPHEVVAIVEREERVVKCYNAIHNTSFEEQDITQVDETKLPDCDLLCYSPPCQSWSNAGNLGGFEDPRGVLFFDALRIIREKKPKYAIMENVKNLASKKFKYEFETMLQLLEQEGYTNHWTILNAADFGIPQGRERVFVVSIRNDIEQEFKFPVGDNHTYKNILEENVSDKYYKVKEQSGKELEIGIYGLNRGFVPNNMFCTLDATYSRNIGCKQDRAAIRDNRGIRRLTELEAFRVMGFDDEDYWKCINNNLKTAKLLYGVAGNSIVVNVLEAIFKELLIHSGVVKI